jgi:predicted ATP-dependent protease
VSNIKHLMLRHDVVDAVQAGQFHIYPMRTVDEALELLTGIPAGERDEEGNFPAGSVNQLVDARLKKLAEKQRAFSAPPQESENGSAEEQEAVEGEEGDDEQAG